MTSENAWDTTTLDDKPKLLGANEIRVMVYTLTVALWVILMVLTLSAAMHARKHDDAPTMHDEPSQTCTVMPYDTGSSIHCYPIVEIDQP